MRVEKTCDRHRLFILWKRRQKRIHRPFDALVISFFDRLESDTFVAFERLSVIVFVCRYLCWYLLFVGFALSKAPEVITSQALGKNCH